MYKLRAVQSKQTGTVLKKEKKDGTMKKICLQQIKRLQEIKRLQKIKELQEIKKLQETKRLEKRNKQKGLKKLQKRKKIQVMITISLCSLIFIGCGTKKINNEIPVLTQPYKNTQRKQEKKVDKNVKELSKGINPFAFALLEELLKKDETIFFSPYSISMALSMAVNGADNKTKEEMLKTLGIENLEEWNKQISYFLNQENKKDIRFSTANSIWLQNGYELANNAEEIFLKPISQYYQADVFEVDFKEQKTVTSINDWVSKKTNDMIPEALKQTSEQTRMILLNAVYLKGEWETKFKKEEVHPIPFYGTSGEQTANMMHLQNESFGYYTEYGLKAIQLPYKNETVVMNIILPEEESVTITEALQALSHKEKLDFLKNLNKSEKTQICTLALPKFELEYGTIELKNALNNLGIKQAFNENLADFQWIQEDLYLNNVYHKAKIEVDEEGSRAAAVTAVEFSDRSARVSEEEKNFIADHPFLFIIQDVESEIILFIGILSNVPTQ